MRPPPPRAPGSAPRSAQDRPRPSTLAETAAVPSGSSGTARAAVRAWLAWRAAHHAYVGSADTATDPLIAMLRDWWREQQLSNLDHCTDAEAARALAHVRQLEWWQRPFTTVVE